MQDVLRVKLRMRKEERHKQNKELCKTIFKSIRTFSNVSDELYGIVCVLKV